MKISYAGKTFLFECIENSRRKFLKSVIKIGAGIAIFGIALSVDKNPKKIQTTSADAICCYANCYSNCYSNCHSNCHGNCGRKSW